MISREMNPLKRLPRNNPPTTHPTMEEIPNFLRIKVNKNGIKRKSDIFNSRAEDTSFIYIPVYQLDYRDGYLRDIIS